MAGSRPDRSSSCPTLRREALLPLPAAARRPLLVVGSAVALVFLASLLDAAVWRQTVQRDELRARAVAAEARADAAEARVWSAEAQARAAHHSSLLPLLDAINDELGAAQRVIESPSSTPDDIAAARARIELLQQLTRPLRFDVTDCAPDERCPDPTCLYLPNAPDCR